VAKAALVGLDPLRSTECAIARSLCFSSSATEPQETATRLSYHLLLKYACTRLLTLVSIKLGTATSGRLSRQCASESQTLRTYVLRRVAAQSFGNVFESRPQISCWAFEGSEMSVGQLS
jgi:hypothetical protein